MQTEKAVSDFPAGYKQPGVSDIPAQCMIHAFAEKVTQYSLYKKGYCTYFSCSLNPLSSPHQKI
jgi:hypothetical protein